MAVVNILDGDEQKDISALAAAAGHSSYPRNTFCLNLASLPDVSNFALKTSLTSPHLLDSPTDGLYSPISNLSLSGLPWKRRPRNMSQSSTDRETSSDAPQLSNGQAPTSHGEPRTNSRKRPSTDTIDYPRRRATIACEICRSRKSRCDGSRPKCRLCSELNAECVYREPGIKLDAGDKLILEHLSRIEGLLHSNLLPQSQSYTMSSHSPAASNSASEDFLTRSNGTNPTLGMPTLVTGFGTFTPEHSNISAMPKTHTTPALNLLQWPMIRDLVSRRYDPHVLLDLEMARKPLAFEPPRSLDLGPHTESYVQAFFQCVNVWYACVNPYTWHRYYRTAHQVAFREGEESCVVLLVLALGSASIAGSISLQPPDRDPPGMPYFAAAWALIPSLMTRNTMLAAQCHILASAYLFYLVRPLEAWNLLTTTSMKLQLLLGSPDRLPPHSSARKLGERVYWNALLFESDLLAELHLPHSGIIQIEESHGVNLPGFFEDEGEEPAGEDELWYFNAEIALRRLLNTVSHFIYTNETPTTSVAQLAPCVDALDRNLDEWYHKLPIPVQFPRDSDNVPLANPVQTVLRLRYFACRTIIFRPYILAVLNDEKAALDINVRENCMKCLDACIRQLENIQAHHAGHLPYLWQGALSIVSQTLLVMGATMSPTLSDLLPPLDKMIENVVNEIERYAHLAPSLRLSAEIIREAETRRRNFLRLTS